MSAFAGWNRDQPSGASSLRASDDQLRSHHSILQALLQQEHYFTDGSANSAGEHKLGSARIYSGASSAVSSSGRSGGLMWDETNSQLVALHAGSVTRLPALATANTWTGQQTFSGALVSSSTATLSVVEVADTGSLKLPIVSSLASIPAAGASMNGRIIATHGASVNYPLYVYVDGKRYGLTATEV